MTCPGNSPSFVWRWSAFGLDARFSGRNDLLIGDRKFSGNAFYKAGHSAYHYGTLLVECDMGVMGEYLIPNAQKLQYHGVQSVPSRVVNLRSLAPNLAVDALEQELFRAFTLIYKQRPAVLDERMLDQPTLSILTKQFTDPEWIYPKSLPYTFTVEGRFPLGRRDGQAAGGKWGHPQCEAVYRRHGGRAVLGA